MNTVTGHWQPRFLICGVPIDGYNLEKLMNSCRCAMHEDLKWSNSTGACTAVTPLIATDHEQINNNYILLHWLHLIRNTSHLQLSRPAIDCLCQNCVLQMVQATLVCSADVMLLAQFGVQSAVQSNVACTIWSTVCSNSPLFVWLAEDFLESWTFLASTDCNVDAGFISLCKPYLFLT